MSLLRDDFNKITDKFKAGSPNITKWLDDATTIVDAHDAKLNRLLALLNLYVVTLATTDRAINANNTSIDELADVLASLIADLKSGLT